MDIITMIGFFAAGVSVVTMSMQTMVPLRIVGLGSNVAFISYGLMIWSLPVVVLHAILLPINVYRLHEMLKLIRDIEGATQSDLSMDWLKPFATRHEINAGETLFRKGEDADAMFIVVSGRLRIEEFDLDFAPGAVVGEMGLLAPGRQRTQTLSCVETAEVLRVTYDKIKELYFQNPKFGFYFLRLTTSRLFDNVNRLEEALAGSERELARLRRKNAPAKASTKEKRASTKKKPRYFLSADMGLE